MEFQPLPNIGLRISPNIECQMIQANLGVEIPIPPTKLVMTEGNKRAIRKSGDPMLFKAMKRINPEGPWFGTYGFKPYNFFVLRSLNYSQFSQETAVHENAHALYYQMRAIASFEDQPSEEPTKIYLKTYLPNISWEKDAYFTNYFFREGFAEWVAAATMIRQNNLSDTERTLAHLKTIVERLHASKKGKLDFNTNPSFLYNFGHMFVFKVMAFLTGDCQMSVADALRKVALNPPKTLSQINEPIPRNYLSSLDLPLSVADRLHNVEVRLPLEI